MPSPAELAAAGPWAVVVAIGTAFGVAFVRGWVVPRFAYDREVKRADDAVAEVTALTAVIRDGLAANAKVVGDGSDAVAKSLDALTDEIRWDLRDRHRLGGQDRNAPP